jgi:hypothetical protein
MIATVLSLEQVWAYTTDGPAVEDGIDVQSAWNRMMCGSGRQVSWIYDEAMRLAVSHTVIPCVDHVEDCLEDEGVHDLVEAFHVAYREANYTHAGNPLDHCLRNESCECPRCLEMVIRARLAAAADASEEVVA